MPRVFTNSALDSLTSSVNSLHQRQAGAEERQMKMMSLNSQLASEKAERDLMPRRLALEEERLGYQIHMEKANFDLKAATTMESIISSQNNRYIAGEQEIRANKMDALTMQGMRLDFDETKIRMVGLAGRLADESRLVRSTADSAEVKTALQKLMAPDLLRQSQQKTETGDIDVAAHGVLTENEVANKIQMRAIYAAVALSGNTEKHISSGVAASLAGREASEAQKIAVSDFQSKVFFLTADGSFSEFKNKGLELLYDRQIVKEGDPEKTETGFFNTMLTDIMALASKNGGWVTDGAYNNPSITKIDRDFSQATYDVVKPKLLSIIISEHRDDYIEQITALKAAEELYDALEAGTETRFTYGEVEDFIENAEDILMSAVKLGSNGQFEFGPIDKTNNAKANIYESFFSSAEAPLFAREYSMAQGQINSSIVGVNNAVRQMGIEANLSERLLAGEMLPSSEAGVAKYKKRLREKRAQTARTKVSFDPKIFEKQLGADNPEDIKETMRDFMDNPGVWGMFGMDEYLNALSDYMFGVRE